jgi:hypothetical protein
MLLSGEVVLSEHDVAGTVSFRFLKNDLSKLGDDTSIEDVTESIVNTKETGSEKFDDVAKIVV